LKAKATEKGVVAPKSPAPSPSFQIRRKVDKRVERAFPVLPAWGVKLWFRRVLHEEVAVARSQSRLASRTERPPRTELQAGLAMGNSKVICVSRESGYDVPFLGGGFPWHFPAGKLLRIFVLPFSAGRRPRWGTLGSKLDFGIGHSKT
jgi:hypothetical protein